MSVITSVAPDITELGLETKELFVLAEVDVHPRPPKAFGAGLARLNSAQQSELAVLLEKLS
jgi:hypothetical protein